MKSKAMIYFVLIIFASVMAYGNYKTKKEPKKEPKLYSDIRKATHIFTDSRTWRWRGFPGYADYAKNNFTAIELCPKCL